MSIITRRNPAVKVVAYVGVIIAAVVTLLPFWWVVIASLRTETDFRGSPGAWWPSSFTWENYLAMFRGANMGVYLTNSIIISVVLVFTNVIGASLAGYALAKLEFPGKRFAFAAVLVGIFMPGAVLFIPTFVIAVQLGLGGSLMGMVVPFMVGALFVFLVRQFASTVPDEILEAARIDGASEVRIFLQIFFPLMWPASAVVGILSFMGGWNQFLWPLLIATNSSLYTLPVGIAQLKYSPTNVEQYGITMAGSVLLMLPVIVLFIFAQKYFVQGMAASVKH